MVSFNKTLPNKGFVVEHSTVLNISLKATIVPSLSIIVPIAEVSDPPILTLLEIIIALSKNVSFCSSIASAIVIT